MRIQVAVGFVVVILAGMSRPPVAEACSCAGVPSSLTAVKGADVVFVGTVTSVESQRMRSRLNAGLSAGFGQDDGPYITTFDVAHVFRGDSARQLEIVGDGATCDVPFSQGEVWLVYARLREGRVTTGKCSRTRLRAEAASDLIYLEGLEQKRPQGGDYDVWVERAGRPATARQMVNVSQGADQHLTLIEAKD